MKQPLRMAALVAVLGLTLSSNAQAIRNVSQTSTQRQVHNLRYAITFHRSKTWRFEDRAGVTRSRTEYAERHTASVPFLRWDDRLWLRRQKHARRLAEHGRKIAHETSAAAGGWSPWDPVAECESGGHWNLVTGNGFYWGLQWVPSTWDSRARLLGFPTWAWFVNHHSAPSREMQIRAATGMSLSNWPICGSRYGA